MVGGDTKPHGGREEISEMNKKPSKQKNYPGCRDNLATSGNMATLISQTHQETKGEKSNQ